MVLVIDILLVQMSQKQKLVQRFRDEFDPLSSISSVQMVVVVQVTQKQGSGIPFTREQERNNSGSGESFSNLVGILARACVARR